jgi:transcriptional regulator with XRE-family HTH domain
MASSELPETTAARRIRELRTQRGLTLRELAAKCEAIDATHLTVDVLQKMETFRRYVSLNDMVAVARALEVSPFMVFMPTTDIKVKVTWNVDAFAHDVLSWWLGHQPRPEVEPDDDARLAALLAFRRNLPYAGQHSRIQIEAGNIHDLANEVSTPKDGQ